MRKLRLLPLALLVPVALALACSKKSSPTQPSTGGGGSSENFASGNFANGKFVHTFNTAGTYRYYCSIHGTPTTGMNADVIVAPATADSPTVTISGMTFTPNPVSVNPGSYVIWVNGSSTHNVTR